MRDEFQDDQLLDEDEKEVDAPEDIDEEEDEEEDEEKIPGLDPEEEL